MLKTVVNILFNRRMGSFRDGAADLKWQVQRRARRGLRDAMQVSAKILKDTRLPRKLQVIPKIGHPLYVSAQITADMLAMTLEDSARNM